MEEINCNLCGCAEYSTIYILNDLLLEKNSVKTRLVKCVHCELIYQNPRPSIDEMEVFYPSDYEPFLAESKLDNKSWFMRKTIEYGLNKRSRFVTNNKINGRLLDIGCATGLFLNTIQQRGGWETNGVEINTHAANIARKNYGLDIFTGTLEEAAFPDCFFDAVTLWDVFEHLHNPSSTLQEIYRILKPGGILVLRVPNGMSWSSKIFGQYWAGLDSPRHMFVFNQYTLQKILDKGGFVTKQMNCRSGNYPTFILSVQFWLTGKGINKSVRNKIIQFLDHPILRFLTFPIFLIGGMRLHGSLITVTAQK